MAFRHHSLGALVASNDPAERSTAQLRLSGLFREHRTREAVAAEVDVDSRTLARWIDRLMDCGLPDPRESAGVGRRRPVASEDVRRQALVLSRQGLTPAEVATDLGFSVRTVAKWLAQAA